jgi:hypothetical protein
VLCWVVETFLEPGTLFSRRDVEEEPPDGRVLTAGVDRLKHDEESFFVLCVRQLLKCLELPIEILEALSLLRLVPIVPYRQGG